VVDVVSLRGSRKSFEGPDWFRRSVRLPFSALYTLPDGLAVVLNVLLKCSGCVIRHEEVDVAREIFVFSTQLHVGPEGIKVLYCLL
jgi:hypothetical protein